MPKLAIGTTPSVPGRLPGQVFALDTARFGDEGLRVGIFASPGAGKGYLLGVLLEELIAAGYPCLMIDPESELWTFRELGALVVGGPHGHAPFDPFAHHAINEAIRFCLDTGTPVVFDLGDLETDRDIRGGFDAIAGFYWAAVNAERRPSVLAVTEAHVIAPQTMPRGEAATTRLSAILNRGRKRGVISLLETQRIADVANSVIAHCNVRFVGRVDFEDDYRRVARSMPKGVTFAGVAALERGSFYAPRLSDVPIRVRARRVTHGGGTPDGGEVTLRQEPAPGALTELAERLAALVEQSTQGADGPESKGGVDTVSGTGKRRGRDAISRARQSDGPAASTRVAELDAELETGRAERARLRGERDALQQQVQRLEGRVREVEEGARAASALRNALAAFMGGGAASAGSPGLDEECVVALIHEHAPGAGAAQQLQPVEALRKRYLERAAARLVDVVRGLGDDEREALLFLVARQSFATINAVAVGLTGSDSGGVRERWSKALQSLVGKDLVAVGGSGRSGRRENVEAWIRSALSPHSPTDDEIRAVRDRALYVLQEADRA